MPLRFPFAVEAVAFFTCACQYTFDTVQYQFIYQVVSEQLNFTRNHSVNYCSANATADQAKQEVADEVSRWTLYSMMSGYVACIIGSTVITSWSDSIGRKIAIAIPVIGTFVAAVMQCIIVTYRLPLYTLIITEILYGATGTYTALINIGSAYLSDVVKLEDRGLRFNILEVSASVGGGMVQIGTGYWINSAGFIPTSIFIACCAFVAAIFIPFMETTARTVQEFSETSALLKDNVYDSDLPVNFEGLDSAGSDRFSLRSLKRQLLLSWKIYTADRCVCDQCIKGSLNDFGDKATHSEGIKKARTWRLWFYAVSYGLYMFLVNGVSEFITMFLVSYPVCFTPNLVGAQAGLSNGLIIAVPFLLILFQGYLKLGGQTIILLGTSARICFTSIMSAARGPVLVFTATGFAVVFNLTTAFMRSEATRLVSSKEQGAMLAILSGMESLLSLFAPLVFLTLYPATLHIFHGFALVVAAMIYAVVLIMMTIVWVADRRTAKAALES